MRYKITIEYNGSNFSGWQKQKHSAHSVQEAIENAILKFTGEKITLYCGGRTDSGVHALGQIAHFDINKNFEPYRIRNAINYHLNSTAISIVNVEVVNNEFHARFSAKKRHYQYKIINRYAPSPLENGYVWQVFKPLDVDVMIDAAQHLIGKHDLSSFRSKDCQAKSPIKTIDNIEILQHIHHIYIKISALSFLHNQVRIITGTLVKFGRHKIHSREMLKILDQKDRKASGVTAPPHGLYLMRIDY
ncbi:MAG: tRNA pseudouridine(38-40) synthase TruA [Wolbachia endosymbiont of Fragariocoptes setiger]|nr:tRNA pseudouridine(38-40) synthase TruA [Wolbachia endosymbiont of Fragariocoptes setiger]